MYRNYMNWGKYFGASPEIDRVKTQEQLLEEDKKKKNRDINSATARALIIRQLTEDNIKFKYKGQFYRAKIEVLLHKNKKAILYVSYKRMYDDLVKIAPAVNALNEIIDTFSKDVSIKNVSPADYSTLNANWTMV